MKTPPHILLWIALALTALAVGACSADPSQSKVPYRATIWGEPPGDRLLMHAPALSLLGDVRTGRFEDHPAQGYLVYGGANTTVTLDLVAAGPGADPVLILYGPRVSGNIWGRPVAVNDDGGSGLNARIDHFRLDALGEYLVVVTSYDRRGAGGYELRVSCSWGCEEVVPCTELACLEAASCYRGYRTDARGCRVCECLDECRTSGDCGASQVCVDGQCRADCDCFDDLAPVCGVDGREYPNACEARCAGVGIAATGPCADECPELTCALACPAGFVTDVGGCQVCECLDPCLACDDIVQPICTQNGLTVANTCKAECVGEVVAYLGRCIEGCELLDACALTCDQGFERDTRGCLICECSPQVCSDELSPECGVNGVTWRNACERERAGVELAFRDVCPPTCLSDAECPTGLTCRPLAAEGSVACAEAGLSERCRGKCVAADAATCLTAADCPLALDCVEGVCSTCGGCSPIYQPVCDGDRTFLNACNAQRCGLTPDVRAGACCADVLLDDCDLECENGFVVDSDGCEVCQCRSAPPCQCAAIDNPVCGVDGQTWGNRCEALCRGVESLFDGPCPDE